MANQGEEGAPDPGNEQCGFRRRCRSIRENFPDSNTMVAVATIALVIVGALGIVEGKKALELTQRAWVNPIGGKLTTRVRANEAIHFQIILTNSGREPAIDVAFKFLNHTIEGYDPKVIDMAYISVPENTACVGFDPKSNRTVIAPTNAGAVGWNFDSQHGEPSLLADEKIANGTKFYVVEGCAAYKTYSAKHITSFCYVMEFVEARLGIGPSELAIPDSFVLPDGVNIPGNLPKPIEAHAFNFAPCSTGFEAN
jgi:hypothetical protein